MSFDLQIIFLHNGQTLPGNRELGFAPLSAHPYDAPEIVAGDRSRRRCRKVRGFLKRIFPSDGKGTCPFGLSTRRRVLSRSRWSGTQPNVHAPRRGQGPLNEIPRDRCVACAASSEHTNDAIVIRKPELDIIFMYSVI